MHMRKGMFRLYRGGMMVGADNNMILLKIPAHSGAAAVVFPVQLDCYSPCVGTRLCADKLCAEKAVVSRWTHCHRHCPVWLGME